MGCSLQGTGNGAGQSQQSSDGTASPREKDLQEDGHWLLGEAGSHSWCEFCWFVVISITLSITECFVPEQNHHLAAARRQEEQHLLSKHKLAKEHPASAPPKHCQDTFSSPAT